MAALRELLATFDLRVNDKAVKKADRTLGGFKSTIQKVGSAIGVFFVARGLKRMISGTIDAADNIGKLSAKLGLSAQSLQEYQFAAGKTGVALTAINMGLQRFIRRAAEAANGTGSAFKTLKKLGIQLKNTDGSLRSTEAVFDDVADAIQGTEDKQERLRIAFALFDSEGVALVNTLKDGSAGLQAMRDEARALGGIMSDELIANAEAAKDEMQAFDETIKGVKNSLTLALMPAIRATITGFQGFVTWVKKSEVALAFLKGLLISLGIAATAAAAVAIVVFGPLLIKFGLIAAAVSLVGLLIEDFVVALRGGESVLGSWAIKLDALLEKFDNLIPGLKALRIFGEGIGDFVADVTFGTSEEAREQEFQELIASMQGRDRTSTRGTGKRKRTVTVRRGETKFNRDAAQSAGLNVPALFQARRETVLARQRGLSTAGATPNINTVNLTVNANGVDPKGVMDIATRTTKAGLDRMLKTANAQQQGVP